MPIQIPLTEIDVQSIGRIVVATSMTDNMAARILWYLLQLDKTSDDPRLFMAAGAAVTANMNASPRLNAIESLANLLHNKEHGNRLRKLVRWARKDYDRRDHIVHAEWQFSNEGQPIAAKPSARTKVKSGAKLLSTEILGDWANDAERTMHAFNDHHQWQRDHLPGVAPPPLPDIPD